jgi:hypothetical protein
LSTDLSATFFGLLIFMASAFQFSFAFLSATAFFGLRLGFQVFVLLLELERRACGL